MANGEGFDIPAGTIVIETAVDMEGLRRDMRELEKRGEQAGERAGGGFTRTFKEEGGKKAITEVSEGMKEVSESASEATEGAQEAEASLGDFASTADEAAQAGGGLALVMSRRLLRGLRGVKGALVRGTSAMVSFAAGGIKFAADGIREMGEEMEASSSIMGQKFAPAVKATGGALAGMAGLVSQAAHAVTALKLTVLGSSTALNVAASNAADEFEGSWNRVLTLIPESVDRLDQLKREVSELGAEVGVTSKVTNDTFYQVLSAMPEMTRRPREALEILRVALETAATGFADGATAAKAITGVLNAFEMEADQAREVTDKLFAAQQQGVLTFQDIASEINKVSGITNALGGSFEDLLAIVATMTGEFSARVPETFTQTRGLIRSIVDPSKDAAEAAKAMGEDFALSADLIREHGLIGALERIVEVTGGSPEAISQIIPEANAQQLVISLASRMGALEGRLQNINSTSGLTRETLEEVNQSWARQRKIFSETFKNDLRQIGFLYNDLRTSVLGAVNALRQMANQGQGGLADFLMESRDAGFELLDQAGQLDDRWERATQRVTEFADEILGIPPSVEDVEDRTRRITRILGALERAGFDVADVFALNAENTDAWVDKIVESELALRDVEERVRSLLRTQELVGPPRDNFTAQLTSRMARVLGMDPGEMREDRGELESPDLPGPISGEFQAAAVEARRARLQVEAFRDFLATGNEEAYERRLETIQREVNRLVAERVKLMDQHGAEAAEIQKLLSLYDRQIERVDILSDEFAGLEDSLRAVGSRMGAIGDDMPLPTGVESEEDLVGFADTDMTSKLLALDRRLQQLRDSGASADEIFVEMQEAMANVGLTMDDLQESSEGLARVILRKLLRANLPAWFLGFEDGAEGAGEETDKLREDLQEIATLAGGILNVADAMGVLGDDARQALGGVQSLVSALGQTAEEGSGFLGTGLTAGGFAGVLGASASIISGFVGALGGNAAENRRVREEMAKLRSSIESLRGSIDRQREALTGLPGRLTAGVRQALRAVFAGRPEGLAAGSGPPFTSADITQRLPDALEQAGLTPSALIRMAEEFGLPTEALKQFFGAGGGPEAFRELGKEGRGELLETLNALFDFVNVNVEELFGTFRGQMDLLQREIELFDIEDPIEKLRRFRELLLEFTNLPDDLRSQFEGVDLTTPEGRQRMEELIQDLFRRVTAGELPEGALGELSIQQLLDLLGNLEGTLDQVSEEDARGGRSQEFTRTRSITEVTGMRMVGVLTTIDFRVAQIVSMMRQGLGLSPTSGIQPVPGAPEMMPARMGGGDVSIRVERGAVAKGAIQVSGAGDPEATADSVVEGLRRRLSEEMAEEISGSLRARGVRRPDRHLRG